MCTASAYQPLGSDSDSSAVVTGGVWSILIGLTVPVAVLPARSVTLAEALSSPPSPPTTVGAGQAVEARPDRASEQTQVTVTAPLFHPAPLAAGEAVPVMVGLVLSMSMPLNVTVAELPALSCAVPLVDWCWPSPRLRATGQSASPESVTWSAQLNVTVTSSLYQPFPLAARSGDAEIVGGLRSMLTVAVSLAELPALSVAAPATL